MPANDFNYQNGSPNAPNWTPDEIEKMRNTVLRADKERNGGRDIDINKPVTPPYSFKKFPMIVYHHARSIAAHDVEKESPQKIKFMAHVPAKYDERVVKSEGELQKALADGYEETPPDFSVNSEPLGEAETALDGSQSQKRSKKVAAVSAA